MDNPALDLFDGHLRSALSPITNTSLSDTQWLQASLPIKHGGLGIRQVRSLALPAFLASAASTSDLQSQILLASACTADTQFDNVPRRLAGCTWSPVSLRPFAGQAVSLGQTILSSSTNVESAISDSCQKARFLAAAAPYSGDWLLALPVTSCGLRLTDEAVRVAVALRRPYL